jgi:hypothetical protein
MKKFLLILFFIIIAGYGYYNYLAYKIYNKYTYYSSLKNKMAVDTSVEIIKDKYPYTVFYFMVH